MAFKLVNRYGNAIYHAETEAQKQELISRGFHEVPQDGEKAETVKTSAKRKKDLSASKGKQKGKDDIKIETEN